MKEGRRALMDVARGMISLNHMKYTRKLMEESTHSFALVIPKEIIEKFGWKEKQKIFIEEMPGKTLRLKDWKRK